MNSEVTTFQRLTENAKNTIKEAYALAKSMNHQELMVIHVFLVFLVNKSTIGHDILDRLGIDINLTEGRVRRELSLYAQFTNASLKKVNVTTFSQQIKDLINEGYQIASEMKQVYVGSEHLLLAMFKMRGVKFVDDMLMAGLTYERVKKLVENISPGLVLQNSQLSQEDLDGQKQDTYTAPDFTKDMTLLAFNGKYPNISGRDNEIKRIIHILSRKTKNNPILVGEAGVGKTAIVEGLVNRIAAKDVPSSLINKRVLNVDVSSIIAGAKLRGDVEERINYIVNEAIEDGNTILFIDEIHNIVGAGSVGAKDTMDMANLLKPHLTDSSLVVIGATTVDEYNRYFETDSALSRRFQPVMVDELDVQSAMNVVINLKKDFENYHKVKIKNEAIEEAVNLSAKYIKDRFLPDKAIDLLDEACASIKIGREIAIEPELSRLGEELIYAQQQKEKFVKVKDLSRAAKFREKEDSIISEITDIIEGKKVVQKKYAKTVTPELVQQIVVDWTKIPLAASKISDKTLVNLGNRLKKRVVGQDYVLENVTKAIQRSHLGLGDGKRPLASFLFLGPTGVGKTELARSLAQELFGDEKLMMQIDMSEMMEGHSISKLIGSPPGYVGYDQGGQLTNFVKRKPYSVVLFDEIEKAHIDTLNLLLQILEEGHLTDAKGKRVDMSNTIVIMTSNIGASEVSNDHRLGFDIDFESEEGEDKSEIDSAYKEMKDRIIEKLRETLRPELINRIDLVDVFRGLNKQDCLKISQKVIDDLKLRLIPKGVLISVDADVVSYVNEEGYSKEYGGRNIRRKVQDIIENGLAQFLLSQKISTKRKNLLEVQVKMKNSMVVFER